MAKITAWLVTLIGLLLVLALLFPTIFVGAWFNWVIALAVFAVGVGKLIRNYTYRKRK